MVLMIDITVDPSESFPYSVRWINASNQVESISFDDCFKALQFVNTMFPHQVDVAFSARIGAPDLCPGTQSQTSDD